jgi:hypothetical protein
MKLLASLTVIVLALTGCAAGSNSDVENTVAPSQSTAPVDSGEPASQELGYEKAIETSYQKLYESGMSETVTSAGDRYILSYSPGEEFVAGLYNVEIDDVILVDDELFFTVANAYRAFQDPATVVTETDTGVSLSNPEFGDFTIVIRDGLVVAGFDNGGSWTGEFSYQPDAMVSALVADILATEG